MLRVQTYQKQFNHNNFNDHFIAFTSRSVLDALKITTLGYVFINKQLVVLTTPTQDLNLALDDSTIYLSEIFYSQLSDPSKLSVVKCKKPIRNFGDHHLNLFPDFPIASKVDCQLIWHKYHTLINQKNIHAFLQVPFLIKADQVIPLNFSDPNLLKQFQLNFIELTPEIIHLCNKAKASNNPSTFYSPLIRIVAIDSAKQPEEYYLFDSKHTQVTLLQDVSYDRQLKIIPKDNFLAKITKDDQFREFLGVMQHVITLGSSQTVAIESNKNQGKRLLLRMLADLNGLNYLEHDLSAQSSTNKLFNMMVLNKNVQSIVFVRNIQAIKAIQSVKNQESSKHQVSQFCATLIKLNGETKNQILVVSCEEFGEFGSIKSTFDVFLKFNPRLNDYLIQQIIQEYKLEYSAKELLALFKESTWRQATKVVRSNQHNLENKLQEMSKVLQANTQVKMEDVGGMESAINEVAKTIVLPQLYPQIFDHLVKPRRGILFFGPPGTGKTLLAKCISTEMNMNFISVKGPEMLNQYIGESEENIRNLFAKAKRNAPALIFFDELDALAPARGNASDSNQVMDRIVAQLLTELDNLEDGVFIVGATNRPDLLDPALMRPGRFDKLLYLGIKSDDESRRKILRALTKNEKLEEIIQEVPKQFTGADFYGLVSNATVVATKRCVEKLKRAYGEYEGELSLEEFYRQSGIKVELEVEDLREALKFVKPSVSEKELKKYEELQKKYT